METKPSGSAEREDGITEITGSGGIVLPSLTKMLTEHLEKVNTDDGEQPSVQ
jgi:hypothetical protein